MANNQTNHQMYIYLEIIQKGGITSSQILYINIEVKMWRMKDSIYLCDLNFIYNNMMKWPPIIGYIATCVMFPQELQFQSQHP